MRDTNKFHIYIHSFKTLFYRFLYRGDQMISCWRIYRWLTVNFKIQLCSSGMSSDLGECFFWGLCKPAIASTDVSPQEIFPQVFWKCMQMIARLRGLVWKQFRCHSGGRVCLSWEACGAPPRPAALVSTKNYWKEKKTLCVSLLKMINTSRENLQIAKHKSVCWAEWTPHWFVLCDLQFFSGRVHSGVWIHFNSAQL